MTDSPVLVRAAGPVVTVALNRPPVNVVDIATLEALDRALAEVANRPEVALVVLRGEGPKAFSAGVSVHDHTSDKIERMLATFHGALGRLRALPMLSLAAVHGHCLGGGMELAAACDLILAEEGARFGQPEIELGCWPPWAAAHYPQRLGTRRSLEMIATGRIFPATEAQAMGLVSWLAPTGGLEEKLAEVSGQLLARSAAVLRLAKRGVRAGEELPAAEALAVNERLYLEELTRTADMEEGLAAFLAKRKPTWQHR